MSDRFSIDELETVLCAATDAEIAQATGVCRRTVQRWRRHGLNPTMADRAAVMAGFHPANIWTEWY